MRVATLPCRTRFLAAVRVTTAQLTATPLYTFHIQFGNGAAVERIGTDLDQAWVVAKMHSDNGGLRERVPVHARQRVVVNHHPGPNKRANHGMESNA